MQDEVAQGFERLAKLESKADSAHKRIDDVEMSDRQLWERVFGNEIKYMDAVFKAHAAHEGVQQMSVHLDNILQSLSALHKRNDNKDLSDARALDSLRTVVTAEINALATKVEAVIQKDMEQDLEAAELRGSRKTKTAVLAWITGTGALMLASLFAWIVISINELRVDEAKIETKLEAVLKDDGSDSEDDEH